MTVGNYALASDFSVSAKPPLGNYALASDYSVSAKPPLGNYAMASDFALDHQTSRPNNFYDSVKIHYTDRHFFFRNIFIHFICFHLFSTFNFALIIGSVSLFYFIVFFLFCLLTKFSLFFFHESLRLGNSI